VTSQIPPRATRAQCGVAEMVVNFSETWMLVFCHSFFTNMISTGKREGAVETVVKKSDTVMRFNAVRSLAIVNNIKK
jgi:hypothetical protein